MRDRENQQLVPKTVRHGAPSLVTVFLIGAAVGAAAGALLTHKFGTASMPVAGLATVSGIGPVNGGPDDGIGKPAVDGPPSPYPNCDDPKTFDYDESSNSYEFWGPCIRKDGKVVDNFIFHTLCETGDPDQPYLIGSIIPVIRGKDICEATAPGKDPKNAKCSKWE